ncbi:MAG TPA: acetyl-CoA carboxylase, biotin carboxyl carrier protein, partial [Clostridiaceae bacterium]|nr:acetyl-CoA carboxylase, biotin carboxyl carrier protein [Clostridiaceae bacterium]
MPAKKRKEETVTEENEAETEMENWTEVSSPIVGTFYSRPSEKEESFVKLGQKVKKGDVLCILEAMKIMNEIKSPHDGTIKR